MSEQNRKPVSGPGRRGMRGPRPKLKDPVGLFKRVMSYVMKYYGIQIAVVAVCIVISVLCNARGTMFMQTLIDGYIGPMVSSPDPDFSGLLHAILAMAGIYAVGIIASFTYNRIMIYVSQGTIKRIRDDMFEHMESLPIRYFDTHPHGDIMSNYTNDVDTLRQLVSQSIPQFINSGLTVVTVVACMLMLSPALTLLTLAMAGLMLFLSGKLAGISGRSFLAQQKDLAAVNGNIEEMMEGQKVVKVFCRENIAMEHFGALNQSLYESANSANRTANIMGPVNAQLGNISYVLCAIAGGVLALKGFMGFTLGGLASFLTFNRNFSMPVNQITTQMNSIVMALAGAERIFTLLDEKPEEDNGCISLVRCRMEDGKIIPVKERTGMWAWEHPYPSKGTVEYIPMKGKVVFDHVDFGYTEDHIVLHDISLYVEAGQKIAFVGSTGAGKTTITNLINRFYDVNTGSVTYDGQDIMKIKKPDLRRSLGIVLQETQLFTGTVEENIRYGKLDATREEVIAAAKLANADGFIRRLPQGYDTMLKGGGSNLSQGQRQLLAIARAAIADPPVLILDEATSSIDTRTERLVQEGMDALMKGRTTFVIAHRLSTVRNSDCIMVLEAGRIIERGPHDELIGKKGKYYQLYTGNLE